MQKNVAPHPQSWLYRDLPNQSRLMSANPLAWIRTLQPVSGKQQMRNTTDNTGKRFSKLKPAQIQLEAEEIEQENRQIANALTCAKTLNSKLKEQLEEEQGAIRQAWEDTKTLDCPTLDFSPAKIPAHAYPSKKHLTKNLNFQIFMAENESKKIQKELDKIRSIEEYFQFVESSTLNRIYKEELERLKGCLRPVVVPEPLVPEDRFERLLRKIERTNERIRVIKAQLSEAQAELTESEARLESVESEADKLGYHLTCLAKENQGFEATGAQRSRELAALTSRVEAMLMEEGGSFRD